MVFFFPLLFEKKKMPRRKHLKQKGRNRRPKARVKSERAEQEFEGKLPPFFAFFFFYMVFFFFVFFFSFLLLEKKKMPRRKHLKQKGRNRTPKARIKSERAEQEFEGKFPPFSTFFFFSMVFLFFVFFFLFSFT